MRPVFDNRTLLLTLTLVIGAAAPEVAPAAPLATHYASLIGAPASLLEIHYRRVSPWQAPYRVSHRYRGGPGARMGLVAQGILPPPLHPHYAYPGFYWNNYFYYPNYRMIYDF